MSLIHGRSPWPYRGGSLSRAAIFSRHGYRASAAASSREDPLALSSVASAIGDADELARISGRIVSAQPAGQIHELFDALSGQSLDEEPAMK